MTLPPKTFRAERLLLKRHGADLERITFPATDAANVTSGTQEILDALAELRKDIQSLSTSDGSLADDYKREVEEAATLKQEMQTLHAAIEKTKQEIVSIRHPGANAEDDDALTTASGLLDAIVGATEKAADGILECAERIDELAGNIKTETKNEQISSQADELSEQVVNIFEACNFQDLTGQRITKIVIALKFIEERVNAMIGIWGEEDFLGIPVPEKGDGELPDDKALISGPQDEDAAGAVSQDDIDSMFD